MDITAKEGSNPRLNTIFLGLAFFWSAVIVVLAVWNGWQSYEAAVQVARSSADHSYRKDLLYRSWVTRHGGVYAPITPETPPNPYLYDTPERDLVAPSGKKLTLVNPAYMTRQVHELGKKEYGIIGHITSLKPIRQENAPDEWEKKALQSFQEGRKEVSSIEPLGNETYFRLMRPLVTDVGCLKCHASQGYRVGDIRGGISVSLPWAPYQEALRSQLLVVIPGYGGLWAIGILGLSMGRKRLRKHLHERKLAEEELRNSKEALEAANGALSHANEELARHRDHLEELVHARTRELAEARDAAESANRAKSAFLANMGHELRTPMNHIIGIGYLMARETRDEEAKGWLANIQKASQHLLRLINDILDYSRIESDRIQIETIDFGLLSLLDHAENNVRKAVAEKGLELVREIDPALPVWLKGDPVRLQQILGNLLGNAVKFSRQGRITLRVRRIGSQKHGVAIRFEVDDQGIGIAPDVQARLFKLFDQGDTSASRKYEGTGLGLALSKRLVSLMAGEMGVTSTPDQGSTFWFTVLLPVGDAPSTAPTETGKVDWEQAGAAVGYMERLLDDCDVQAQTLWGESRHLMEPVLQDRLDAFVEAMEGFDFEAAVRLLREAVATTPQLHLHP